MDWEAIDQLRPAYESTREFLLPISIRQWVIVGIIAFFISGMTGVNVDLSPAGSFPSVEVPGEPVEIEQAPPADLPIDLFWLALIGIVLALIGLLFLVIAAIMEFVFVRVVTDRSARIRGYFGAHVRNGLALFVFRLGVIIAFGMASALVAAALIALFLLTPLAFVLAAIVALPLFLGMAIGLWAVMRFTDDFVVPIMIAEGRGFVGGWKLFWGDLTDAWKEYGVYAVVRAVLGIVASIVVGIGFAIAVFVLAIPFGLLAVGLYVAIGWLMGEFLVFVGFLVAVGTLFLLAAGVLAIVFVLGPVQTYLRYYSLFVLGGISPAYDLVEMYRPRPTEDGTPPGTPPGITDRSEDSSLEDWE